MVTFNLAWGRNAVKTVTWETPLARVLPLQLHRYILLRILTSACLKGRYVLPLTHLSFTSLSNLPLFTKLQHILVQFISQNGTIAVIVFAVLFCIILLQYQL